ncbi:MAG: M15 family metallopeptidase [Campylobacterales bacterium]|nr:M15 family metallopeptidase [Campylobacterales bacterium]
MINSRDINALYPEVKEKALELIELCKKQHIDIIITSTFRDTESQNYLYQQGRTRKGKIVTHAKGGQSFHNYRVAFDVVPVRFGKAVWNDMTLWKKIGAIGISIGLEWAGNWKTFKEYPHFQYTKGLKLADFQAGKAHGVFYV